MPAKGRRVASRQAQLGRRRRRQDRSSDGISVVEAVTAATETESPGSASTQTQESTEPERSQPSVAAPRPELTLPRRSPTRARPERTVAYNYVGSELRRIGVLSGTLFGFLIILAFIL